MDIAHMSLFALKDLLYDLSRSVLTILGLMVLVFSYLLLDSFSEAYHVFGQLPQSLNNLLIISADVLDPMESTLDNNVLQAAIAAHPDTILKLSPCIFRHMRIQNWVMQVRAVPLEDMTAIHHLTLLEGAWPANKAEVVVSEGAIQAAHWKVGTALSIYGSEFKLVGIVRAAGSKFASVWMSYPAGLDLFGSRRGYQMGYLQVARNTDVESLRTQLQADPLLADRYAVYQESSLTGRYAKTTHDIIQLNQVLMVVALLAITFGTYNATSLTINERSREIATLRVIGFGSRSIRAFLFERTLLQTIIGYCLGWALATLFIHYNQAASSIIIHGSSLILTISTSGALAGFALTILFAGLGIWLPTRSQFRKSRVELARV